MSQGKSYSTFLQILSIVFSLIFFWGFGITLLIAVLNVGIGFPANFEDFKQAFLQMAVRDQEFYVQDYLQMSERAKMPVTSQNNYDDFYYGYGLKENLRSYEQRFDAKNTNYRFSATDADGNLLLTNDPDYGKDLPLLTSNVYSYDIYLEQRDYQVQKHFDDPVNAYQEITYGNVSKYLDAPEEYMLWFFSDNRVDHAYHNGLTVKTFEDPYTEYINFDTTADANDFDYTKAYGERCTWKIVAKSTAEAAGAVKQGAQPREDNNGKEEQHMPTVFVEVKAYGTRNEFETTLESYYNMKSGDIIVQAADEKLEEVLMKGLDITIRGEHAVTMPCYIRSYLYDDLPVDDTIRANYSVMLLLFRHSEWYTILMFVLLVLTVISCIVMCTAAGHTPDSDGIYVSKVHSLAYEFFWALPPLSAAASWVVLMMLSSVNTPYRVVAIFCAGMILCIAACCILWLYTTAIRTKAGTFWTSFGIFRVFSFLFSLFKSRTFSCISFLVYSAALFAFNVIALLSSSTVLIVAAFVVDLLTLLFMIYSVYAYFELHRHVKQMETGDFTPAKHPVPLCADFRNFDRSLNEITGKVADIVAQQTKAEHLRTELITNVSHDLKTPLTSIVNYVDLLSREPMQTETAGEYLEILRRQAARLKKLTIDLVDASKASTGNLNVELMPTDIQVLLSQIAGEYEEQLEKNSLSLLLNTTDEPLMILADGRQIWRVFDNLLNNACKYALTGTRVYLDVKTKDDHVTISLKNISAQPLNVSADELMERFVRGDASRHTEGSGLGLSIARDLTALQNGVLRLSTDGDLFKAHLTFPLYHPPEPEPPLPSETPAEVC